MLKNVDMSNAFILCVCNFAVSSWQYQSQVSIVPLYTLRKMHFILQQPLLSFYVLLSVLCFYFWFYFISWKMLESLHSLLSFFFSCITINSAFLKWLKTSAFTQELHHSQNFKGHLGPCMKNLAPLNSFFFPALSFFRIRFVFSNAFYSSGIEMKQHFLGAIWALDLTLCGPSLNFEGNWPGGSPYFNPWTKKFICVFYNQPCANIQQLWIILEYTFCC